MTTAESIAANTLEARLIELERRAAVLDILLLRPVPPGVDMPHLLHLPAVQVDGDTATSVMFFASRFIFRPSDDPNHRPTEADRVAPPYGGRQGTNSGFYNVTYRRTAQGWRIAERVEYGMFRPNTAFLDVAQIPRS